MRNGEHLRQNEGSCLVLEERAAKARHEMFSDVVLDLIHDRRLLLDLLSEAGVFTDGELKTRVHRALRIG